jgi:hypothetical protein
MMRVNPVDEKECEMKTKGRGGGGERTAAVGLDGARRGEMDAGCRDDGLDAGRDGH